MNKEYRNLNLRFLVLAILIQIYSLINIAGMINLSKSISFLFPQLFEYGYYPTMYTYTYNLHRTMLMEPQYSVNNESSLLTAHQILNQFYHIDEELDNV